MKKAELKVEDSGIEEEILDIMSQEDILTAISDEKQKNRLILNCFCSFLNEITSLRKEFDDFMQMISVCSADKLSNFFKELQKNVADEANRIELQEKISKSHKKSKKSSKNSKKSVK